MGVRVVFPDMGKDPSVQLIEKTITENGTYDAITDGANGYSKVNVNVEGGGGSSDFSTANVTVNVEGYSAGMPRYGIANAPYIDQADKLVEGIGLPTSGTYHAVLYMGSVEWQINAGSDDIPITGVNVTGSAEVSEYSGDYFISITGDCSITVNYGTK